MPATLFYASIFAFCVGIGLQTVFTLPLELITLGFVLSFGLAILWRRNQAAPAAPQILLVSVWLGFLSIGLLRLEIHSWQFNVSNLEQSVNSEVTFTGVVVKEPDVRAQSTMLTVQTDSDRILVSTDRLLGITYGDEIAVVGTLQRPTSFATDLGRVFDYPAYLEAKQIEYVISFAQVEVVGTNQGNMFIAPLLKLKQVFMDNLEQVLPEPQVGLAQGLLLGVKQALGVEIEDNFRRTGIIHIVVLSGYNVMLVVAFFLFCFSFFFSPKQRMIGGIIAITGFALLVGLSATVVRASIMASLLLLAQGFGQQYNVMRALFFAGTVMLLLNPALLMYDIGFQLSFMATVGLLLITPHFESMMVIKGRQLTFTDFFFATLATQIAVLPLLLYHIGEVSLIAVVVNMLVLPVVPIAMLLTFFTGVLAFVSLPLAALVGFLANLSLQYILLIAAWFAQIPFAAVTVPEFGVVGVFVLYALIGGVLWMLYRRTSSHTDFNWTVEEEKTPTVLAKEKTIRGSKESVPKIFR